MVDWLNVQIALLAQVVLCSLAGGAVVWNFGAAVWELIFDNYATLRDVTFSRGWRIFVAAASFLIVYYGIPYLLSL